MALSREEILAMVDLNTKEITVPNNIKGWAGKKLFIKTLTRGDQDMYLMRQFGSGKVNSTGSEFDMVGLYGHDAWLCARGLCDENGKRIFTDEDAKQLDEKSGEFVGWCAVEIVKFSGMLKDAKASKELANQEVNQELKN